MENGTPENTKTDNIKNESVKESQELVTTHDGTYKSDRNPQDFVTTKYMQPFNLKQDPEDLKSK